MARSKLPFGGHKFYGSTTIGARGQMVIPIKARNDFRIKNGEELLVLGAHGRFLTVMKFSEVKGFVSELTEQFKEIERMFKKRKQ